MGYNNERASSGILWLDCETIPRSGAIDLLGPVRASRSIKDPEKIAADIEKRTRARQEEAGLDIDCNQIVCVVTGVSVDSRKLYSVRDMQDEKSLLEAVWAQIRAHLDASTMTRLGGFNCLGFDIPLLKRRAQMLGVPTPHLQIGRWRHDRIVDLMQLLTWDGLIDAKPLDVYCRLFGLDVEPDEISGAQVAAAIADGRWDQVERHCLADVKRSIELYIRAGFR